MPISLNRDIHVSLEGDHVRAAPVTARQYIHLRAASRRSRPFYLYLPQLFCSAGAPAPHPALGSLA
jgi:hypothetical protein